MKRQATTASRVSPPIKIVLVGNVGAGKTTAISSVSETPMIGTEAKATEADALHRKTTTTVGIEYGVLHIHNTKVHLYGTPGQHRFDFMASIACQGAAHRQPLAEVDYFLKQHGDYLKNYPAIVAITHYDDNDTQTNLIEYHLYLKGHGISCPVMRLDARDKRQVRRVVEKLYGEIINRQAPIRKPDFGGYCRA